MLAYDANQEEKENLDEKKLSQEISTKVWQKKGKDVYFDNDFIIWAHFKLLKNNRTILIPHFNL